MEGESYVYQGWVEGGGNWQVFTLFWDEFKRVDWEENAGAPFAKPEQVSGLAFGFNTPENTEIAPVGTIYIDDLALGQASAESAVPEVVIETEPDEVPAPVVEKPSGSPIPCIGGLVLPIGLAGLAFGRRRK